MDLSLLEHQPTLVGQSVRLEPTGPEHLDGLWPLFDDPALEGGLTGTLADFAREQVRAGLARARERHDRADWTIIRQSDGLVLGEAVLFQLDEDVEAMEFRIALVGEAVFGRGYGTESTRLVRDFAFDRLGLHRLTLEVTADNPAALRVYRKCGFVVEGRRRQAQRRHGLRCDVIDMALLARDPRP